MATCTIALFSHHMYFSKSDGTFHILFRLSESGLDFDSKVKVLLSHDFNNSYFCTMTSILCSMYMYVCVCVCVCVCVVYYLLYAREHSDRALEKFALSSL